MELNNFYPLLFRKGFFCIKFSAFVNNPPYQTGGILKILFKTFISVLFCLCFTVSCGGNLKGEQNHVFYLYSKSSNAKIITLDEEKASSFFYFKNTLKGESVEFSNKESVFNLLSDYKAKKIFYEIGEDFSCEYYYSEKINDYIILKGQKINLHVCYGKHSITVGSPLVFGSF